MKKKESASKPTSARLLKHTRPADLPEDKKPSTPFTEAAKSLTTDELTTAAPKQRELLAPAGEAAVPEPVQNGRILATYVGLGLERDKDNEKLIHLDFSFPLEKIHDGFVPRRVKEAWEWMKTSGNPLVQVGDIPAATVGIFLDPKEKKPLFKLVGAEYTKAVIQVVEETGKGKSKLVTRLKFRLRVERDNKVVDFAAWHDGEEFWLRMEQTQEELGI